MAKRLLLPLALVLVLAAPAVAGDSYGNQKAQVDAKLAHLQAKIAAQHRQEEQLNSQISGLTSQIRGLEQRVGDVSSRLATLQADLALHQQRLNKLTKLYNLQTQRFYTLKHGYPLSAQRLNLRRAHLAKQTEPTAGDLGLLRAGASVELRLHLAGLRTDHEPLRDAVGDAPSRRRHRRAERDARPRRRRRDRDLVRLDVRLREPRDDRPPQRPRKPLR